MMPFDAPGSEPETQADPQTHLDTDPANAPDAAEREDDPATDT